MRQAALRSIVDVIDPQFVPFIVLLAADYVIEIVEHVGSVLSELDHDIYGSFARENRT